MKEVLLYSRVDEEKCNGDKLCERICPTKAITVESKKARVDETKCVACVKCFDVCPEGAVEILPRSEPLVLSIDPMTVDQTKLEELCRSANYDPEEVICWCNVVKVKEVAAAILDGATTLEQIALKTGIVADCGMFCIGPVQRIMEAAGLDPIQDSGRFHASASLWKVSEEVARKYPEYFIEEEKQMYHDGVFHSGIRLLKPRGGPLC